MAQRAKGLAWCFFFLLAGHTVLRPIRDSLAVQYGVDRMPFYFTLSCVGTIAIVPIYGALASRHPPAKLFPLVYGASFSSLLVLFAFHAFGVSWAGPLFFVSFGISNLLGVSLFWALAVDLCGPVQAKRCFGAVAAAGNAGALAGPTLCGSLVGSLGPLALLPVSAACLLGATLAAKRLAPRDGGRSASPPQFLQEARFSPYVLGASFLVLGYSLASTLLYLEQASLLSRETGPRPVTLFASVDLVANLIGMALQLLLTKRVFLSLGVPLALAALPIAALSGFLALTVWPIPPLLLLVLVVTRAGNLALLRPGREILFTPLGSAVKYRSKPLLETMLYRGGDAASAWLFVLFRSRGLGLSRVALVGAVSAALWAWAAYTLGRMFEKHDEQHSSTAGPLGHELARDRGSLSTSACAR